MHITHNYNNPFNIGLGGGVNYQALNHNNITTTTTITDYVPNTDSTLSLVKQLVTHYIEDSFSKCRLRDRDKEEAFKGKLKVLVYSILLSHRKDYVREKSCLHLNELEEVIWHTHILRQQRRFDDGNALDNCLHRLREQGHLESGSDVRRVMRFLVALKGQGGPEGEKQQPILAQLRPRVVQEDQKAPNFLPSGPLQYGDTFLQRAEIGRPYPSFPTTLYTALPNSLPQGTATQGSCSAYDGVEEMMRLSDASPGTGVTHLLTGKSQPIASGKVLGALLQESKKAVNPNMTLSLPELPVNPKGYTPFTLSALTATINTKSGGDEGYASSNSADSHSTGEEGEDDDDPWEDVLASLPITQHRTWEALGHIPETKEKPFITEAGGETTHNIWVLHQELWSIVGGQPIPKLYVRTVKELCQDVLYLLIGVPSHSFPWSEADECFIMKEGLCHSCITPEALRGSLLPLVECGTLFRRLEILYSTPKSDTHQLLTHGSVYTSFTFAVCGVLRLHREMVLSLWDETILSALQDKAQPLVKKIKFIASICKVNDKTKSPVAPEISKKKHLGNTEIRGDLPRGLALLGELLTRMVTTQDRDCLLLLVSIFRSSCIPFFSYLEEWIYHGVCSDPGVEFMIGVNGSALLSRDRTYWTSGYTLRSQASVPPMLREVLEEVFVCGKTLNLLKLCSRKHYLVSGNTTRPRMKLCVSGEELTHMQEQCQVYAAHMDHVATQLQVTVQQKAEEEKAQKLRLMMISSNKHAAVLREIEGKMQERGQALKEQKAKRLKELKDEMIKAEKRKQEEKEKQAEEDLNIAQEQQEIEKKKIEEETVLREKVEQFYREKMEEAERAEAKARWRMQRCSLATARKEHIQNTSWTPEPTGNTSDKPTGGETANLTSLDTSDSLPEPEITEDQHQGLNVPRKRPHNMNTGTDIPIGRRGKTLMSPQTPDSIPENEAVEYQDFPRGGLKRPHNMYTGTDAAMGRRGKSLISPQTPDSIPETEETEQQQEVIGGALKRPHNMNTGQGRRVRGCGFSPYHLQTERSEDLLRESPNQEVSSVSEMTASMTASVMSTSSDFMDTPFDENLPDFEAETDPKIQTIPESTVIENLNYAKTRSSVDAGNDKNGNGSETDVFDPPPILLTGTPDANANIPENILQETSRNEMQERNTEQDMQNLSEHQQTTTTDATNTSSHNLNELVLEFKERRARAAATKEKVLNEYQSMTTNKNNMNILRSRPVPSSAAARNKQRMMETEYGMTDFEPDEGYRGLYSRQVSSTSTCSLRSCSSSSERPMSTSTTFTTPDEERPVLIDQDPTPPSTPATPQIEEVIPVKDLVEVALKKLSMEHKTTSYDLEYLKLMDQEPLLDITGTALKGKPNTRNTNTDETTITTTTTTTIATSNDSTSVPSTLELSCLPVYFIRSIRMHLAIQSRLVNESLLSEMLVEGSLLGHFSALRSLLLLHDAHFARALTSNLFDKLDHTTCPGTLLVPSKLNHILYKSVAESCWSTSPLADNLSFVITNIPPVFTHNTSIIDCLELKYRVSWPHNLVLDDAILSSYSRVWCFLASLHHAIWASDNLFCHTTLLSRQDKEGRLSRSPQFHQLCLHRHKIHHFLQALQAYVIGQIHQISWSRLEEKLHSKVTSLDHLYSLHNSFIDAIISRCFLSQKGQFVQQLIREVFSGTLRFSSQFLSHSWRMEEGEGGKCIMVHPVFNALQDTFKEFESRAALLHKMLVKVGQRVMINSHQQQLLSLLDFNEYYINKKATAK